ncbi:hypothetical protein [uncultured Hoeflea sp.]|uniref:hypothetical protein n=1 Tax=uncultured Hoeflea sp. TaxID=538666 RepID=UPI0026291D56|nr:hypothetical protein [uncultured Hoeflea sp.]
MVLLFIIAVLVVSQVVMYRLEGGLKVADGYAEPPLSTVFHAKFSEPLAATDNRGLSHLGIVERWFYWRALRKFPTLDHCLTSPAKDNADAFDFNWKSMRASEQAQLCLHHMSVRLKDPVQIAGWLRGQGFNTGPIAESINKGIFGVYGIWNTSNNNNVDPFSIFSTFRLYVGRLITSNGIYVEITIDEISEYTIDINVRYQAEYI